MKKLIFTLFGLMQMVWVMAAAPATSGNGESNRSQVQNARLGANMSPREVRKNIKPWLIVAVNGEGMLPGTDGRDPKFIYRDVYETPAQYKDGRPKVKYMEAYETRAELRAGRPKGTLVAATEGSLHK